MTRATGAINNHTKLIELVNLKTKNGDEMQVMVNGTKELIEEENLTVARLLAIKEVESPEMVSVQVNGKIVDRQSYGSQAITEGDEVDFLYFMGGGA